MKAISVPTLALACLSFIAQASGWAEEIIINRAPFEARNLDTVQQALSLAAPQPSNEIQLKLPDIAADGKNVPAQFSSRLAQINRVALLGLQNEHPLIAEWIFAKGVVANAALAIRLAHTGKVMALLQSEDKKVWKYAREVKVTSGDCTQPLRKQRRSVRQATPLTLSASLTGEITLGLPEIAENKKIPAHLVRVTHLQLKRNDSVILEFNWASDIAANSTLVLQQSVANGEHWTAEAIDTEGNEWKTEYTVLPPDQRKAQ